MPPPDVFLHLLIEQQVFLEQCVAGRLCRLAEQIRPNAPRPVGISASNSPGHAWKRWVILGCESPELGTIARAPLE